MTQEDKKLLLVDLCSRLPYGVIVFIRKPFGCVMSEIEEEELTAITLQEFIENDDMHVFPYLRPMSSMTEEEENEYWNIDNRSYSCPMDYAHIPASERIDWFNAHHFDYRGLIEKDLAIAVTPENNPYIKNKS